MCESIFFIIALLQSDENAQVVDARHHTNTSAGEFDSKLVKAVGRDTFDGTVDPESRYGWVV